MPHFVILLILSSLLTYFLLLVVFAVSLICILISVSIVSPYKVCSKVALDFKKVVYFDALYNCEV